MIEAWNRRRAAQHCAKLVPPQFALVPIEKIPCVEQIVAKEFEQRPVQAVSARLENHVHHSAREPSVLGGVSGGLHLELLQGIQRRPSLRSGVSRVLVVEAVDDDVTAVGAGSVHGHPRAFRSLLGRLNARHHEGEIGEVAAFQGHPRQLLARDHVAPRAVLGIEQRNLGLHFHGFRKRAHFEPRIQPRRLIHLEFEAGFSHGAESGAFNGHFVVSGAQIGDRELAARCGHRRLNFTGIEIPGANRGVCHPGSRLIVNRTHQSRGGCLRHECGSPN